jgi:putative ABC transport system permease protein
LNIEKVVSQFFAVLRLNLASVLLRPGPALMIVIGVTCTVGVLVSMLAMGAGARRQAMGNVRADRVVLTTAGAVSAMQSSLSKEEAQVIETIPEISKGTNGEPAVVFEVVTQIEAHKKSDNAKVFIPLYGVTEGLAAVRPEIHLTAGRLFQPGLRELIVSERRAREYRNLAIGDKREMHGVPWTIVGQFTEGAADGPSSLYADAGSVLSAFTRSTYNRATVRLQSASAYDAFASALKANPIIHVEARHERDVVAATSGSLTKILDFVSLFVGSVMGFGATLGSINSLFAIVDSRRREIATLRAIGFGSGAVVAAVLAESLVLALPGAFLGAALATVLFNGLSASPFGVTFNLAVTPSVVALGIAWSLGMGAIGGVLPALRVSRVPVTEALRAT